MSLPCPQVALSLCPLLPGEPAWGSTAGSGSQCLPAAFCCGACAGLGGLSEIYFFFLPFFSRLSNWKSFDTRWPFTQGRFLIDILHHLSSPKYVLSKEFPSSCSFMERSLKSQETQNWCEPLLLWSASPSSQSGEPGGKSLVTE